MNDDEFPDIIGSGTEHHVSVSERTGNAKTPQNHVSSHEEETEALKRNFEAQAHAALEEKKALAAALAEHAKHLSPEDASADANIQKIAADKDIKNSQTIANVGATKPNVQSLPPDSAKANVQSVGSDTQKDNIQALTGEKGNAPNQQKIDSGNPFVNKQSITNGGSAPNQQTIDKGPALAANRQVVGQPPTTPNVQGIPTDTAASNKQKITTVGNEDNQQPVDQNGLGANRQPVGQPPTITPNKQVIGAHDPSLNRQGVDNGNLQSHFEALPSGAVERKKVDFPTSNKLSGSASPAASAASSQSARQPSAKITPSPRAPLTAQELEEAKRKREKFSDEFHGRLAGIKHNVDELNDRLTDFEEKTQKDDANLIKGNPDDFKVDLG